MSTPSFSNELSGIPADIAAELEDHLLDRSNPPEEMLRAGTLGACFLAALIHQSLRDTIRKQGLPRPLCVLAACDGVYPFFDAPVAGWDDCLAEAANAEQAQAWPGNPEDDSVEEDGLAGAGSLLGATLVALLTVAWVALAWPTERQRTARKRQEHN